MIEEYDPSWPARYQEAASELVAASGGQWLVEHIGSTAVEGLAAKPVIDLAVRVDRHDDVLMLMPALESLGWVDVGAGPRTHLVLVKQREHVRTHIAHFFEAEQWETCNQRLFRDWLRAHPDDRVRYEQVKRAAAAETGGREYTARKTELVQAIVDRARSALGLPLVDVWDK